MRFLDRAQGHIVRQRRPDRPTGGLDRARYRATVAHRVKAGAPGRGLVEVEVLFWLLYLRQVYGRDRRGALLHQLQRAEVERLDDDAVLKMLAPQERKHGADEVFGVQGFLRVRRVDLGLDVEAHVGVARAPYEIEHLGEGWNARAGDHLLLGEAPGVVAPGADLADVVGLDLGEGQADVGNAVLEVLAVRGTREVRVQAALVRDHDDAVLGDPHVQFQRVHAHRQRIGEGLQGVLRTQRAAAAVRFHIEGSDPHAGRGRRRGGRLRQGEGGAEACDRERDTK